MQYTTELPYTFVHKAFDSILLPLLNGGHLLFILIKNDTVYAHLVSWCVGA